MLKTSCDILIVANEVTCTTVVDAGHVSENTLFLLDT